jgi:hypothetical protein
MKKFIRGLPWDDLNEIQDDSVLSWFKLADSAAPPKSSNAAVEKSDERQDREDEIMGDEDDHLASASDAPQDPQGRKEDEIMGDEDRPARASDTPQDPQGRNEDEIMGDEDHPARESDTPQDPQGRKEDEIMGDEDHPARASDTPQDPQGRKEDEIMGDEDYPARASDAPQDPQGRKEDDSQNPPASKSHASHRNKKHSIMVPPASTSNAPYRMENDEHSRDPPTSRPEQEVPPADRRYNTRSEGSNVGPNFRVVHPSDKTQGPILRPRLQTDKILGKRKEAPQSASSPKKSKGTVQSKPQKEELSKVGHSLDAPIDVDSLFVSINAFVFIFFPQNINLVRTIDHPCPRGSSPSKTFCIFFTNIFTLLSF